MLLRKAAIDDIGARLDDTCLPGETVAWAKVAEALTRITTPELLSLAKRMRRALPIESTP